MSLGDLLEQVNSKETFLQFVQALANDKRAEDEKESLNPSSSHKARAQGWENNTIATFLQSVQAFGEDSELITEKPDWKSFALLIYAGKFYE